MREKIREKMCGFSGKLAAMAAAVVSGACAAVTGVLAFLFGALPQLCGSRDAALYHTADFLRELAAERERVGTESFDYESLAQLLVALRGCYGVFFVLALVLWCGALYVLLTAAGRRRDGTVSVCFLDKLPFGVYTLAVGIGCGTFVFLQMLVISSVFMDGAGLPFCVTVELLCAVLGQVLFYGYLMSIAVRVKTKSFWRSTLLFYLWKPLRRLGEGIEANLPLAVKCIAVFAVVSLVELRLLVDFVSGTFVELFFLWKCLLFVLLLVLLRQFGRLREGGARIARGDYSHPIDTRGMLPEGKRFADDLNSVQTGVAAAVEEKLRSERFRTELITNVSHDIKTPLTSIINYADLIKKEPVSDEKLLEYIGVLDRQAARLKKLIEDLMEASKASTGNLPVNWERCDAAVMLTQLVGEYEQRTTEKGLELLVESPEPPVPIRVDGRHLWRIFDNLMGNICKYALSGTRVYVSLERRQDRVLFTFRNIAKNRLTKNSEELCARFVRGDSSRSTEGSGLGLSIAKSLAELMNGTLTVQTDGDLFKVIVSFAGEKD